MKKMLILCAFLAFASKISVAQTLVAEQHCDYYASGNWWDYASLANDFMYEFEDDGWYMASQTNHANSPVASVSYLSVKIEATGFNPADSFTDCVYAYPTSDDALVYKYMPGHTASDYSNIRLTWLVQYSDGSFNKYVWDFQDY